MKRKIKSIKAVEKRNLSCRVERVYKFTFAENCIEPTLLSTEEWEKAKEIKSVPQSTSHWWLRSPGHYDDYAAYVAGDGNAYDFGVDVLCKFGVRPAFKIPNLNSKEEFIGSKIFVENTLCTVIDKDYVLSDTVICDRRFGASSIKYETSEIKAFINSEEFKEMLK